MDFSHDSIASIADSRDAQAQGAMIGLKADEVKQLNVDCPKGLWLLLAALRDMGQVKAQVTEHGNSARLTGTLNQPNVTSYFTVYFLK
jgi:hypothetical protein